MYRWTRDKPAPEAVAFMVALDRMMAGSGWSARKLAEYAGWTRWSATRVLGEARAFHNEWQGETNQPLPAASHRPPTLNNVRHLQAHSSHKPATNQPQTSHHASASYKDTTEQPQPLNIDHEVEGGADSVALPDAGGGPSLVGKPEPSITKEGHPPTRAEAVDLTGLWTQMEDVRLERCQGTRRAELGKRREALRIRVQEHGPDAVLHAWRWLWQSKDHRAQFLRDGGYGIGTFLRAGKLRDYVDRSSEWNPDTEIGGAEWFSDDDFDEHGNLRHNGGPNGAT